MMMPGFSSVAILDAHPPFRLTKRWKKGPLQAHLAFDEENVV
jgi:hypothetical protein